MKKPMVVTIAALIVVFGGLFAFYQFKNYMIAKFFSTFTPAPSVISTAVAQSVVWQPYLTAVGSVSSANSVAISPEVAGTIKKILFTSGKYVKQGTPLIQLDDASEQAQREDIVAQLHLAQTNLDRARNLFDQKAISQAAMDDALVKVKQLKANLENIDATISKKLIRAPFDGNIGINQVDLGQYVSAGFVCTNLQASDAFIVKFSLPQQEIRNVFVNQKILITSDAYPDESFNGFVTAIDSKVDENTRTIELQASVDNTSHKLYPGMFVGLKLFLTQQPNSVVVPQTAIAYTLYGDSAFLVTLSGKQDEQKQETGTVKRVFVKTGDKQEGKVVILEGMKAGDIVVQSGQSKLEDGSAIVVNNSNPM